MEQVLQSIRTTMKLLMLTLAIAMIGITGCSTGNPNQSNNPSSRYYVDLYQYQYVTPRTIDNKPYPEMDWGTNYSTR